MYIEHSTGDGMPVGFAMALSADIEAFYTFLSLSDREQDRIISDAKRCTTQRERQILAMSLSKDKKGEKYVKKY